MGVRFLQLGIKTASQSAIRLLLGPNGGNFQCVERRDATAPLACAVTTTEVREGFPTTGNWRNAQRDRRSSPKGFPR
ncbi:hypothetical protein DP117_24555 [Brasilonema sp. UFV-L1]|nr:hypothetical protein [Brasilonema sp. UFV-L1]